MAHGTETTRRSKLQALLDGVRMSLDQAAHDTDASAIREPIRRLCAGLNLRRQQGTAAEWQQDIDTCRQHPLAELLLQDPYIAWCRQQPRGYAGDAALIDFLYGERPAREETQRMDDFARRLNATTTAMPAGGAVCQRRDRTADLIDAVAASTPGTHVLSVACGHCRELSVSQAAQQGDVERFVALDQDDESLDVVQRDYGHLGVETVSESVTHLLRNPRKYGTFDLIYAGGLYDYLSDVFARRLTDSLLTALRPGGRLLIGNFAPGLVETGFMEAFMDWFLIYRTTAQVQAIADGLTGDVADCEIVADDDGQVVYLMLTKVVESAPASAGLAATASVA